MKTKHLFLPMLAATLVAFAGAASAHGPGEKVETNFSHAIPNIPGKSVVAVEVLYQPGAASASHSHAKSAFIYAYVVSGQVESKVDDGRSRIYKAGESFHENPGSRHPISRNASKTEPAKLLAVFIVDTDETELTTFDK